MSVLRQIFETLREHYADKPYLWWSDDPLEVIVGAVLVQGSTWKSVGKVIDIMYPQGFMDFEILVQIPDEQLANVIRSVGFQSKKAKRLKALAQLFLEHGGNIQHFFARDTETVRQELLHVPGIGAGTADNIMLYAGNMPVYMVDIFTIRLMRRHGLVSPTANEREIQALILRELTPDEEPYGADLFKKLQEYVVRLGRDFCDKTQPHCAGCPLRSFLPDGGTSVETSATRKIVSDRALARAERTLAPASIVELSDTERQVLAAIGTDITPIDKLAAATQLPIHIVRATIAMLQMHKCIRQVEGNCVKRIIP
jgi:endonuclease-3 related protein